MGEWEDDAVKRASMSPTSWRRQYSVLVMGNGNIFRIYSRALVTQITPVTGIYHLMILEFSKAGPTYQTGVP